MFRFTARAAAQRARIVHTARVPRVTIKPGHVQPLWAGHPWVYAQAVERVEGGATAGEPVDVHDPRGLWLGRGLYSPGSAIPVRICSHEPDVALDAGFFARRLEAALQLRQKLGLPSERTNAFRLVHAEGDYLPGLIVDKYADVLAVQFGTLGMKRREAELLAALEQLLRPRAIIDRTSERAAELEGFQATRGQCRGAEPVTELDFRERGLQWRIPLELGQKTGYYLDQRSLRGRVEQLAAGRRVLDVYSYVGPFALAAARAGASEVVSVDSSALAQEVAADNALRNGLAGKIRFERDDALEAMARAGRSGGYELVICDPPKLAQSRAARERAAGNMRRVAAAACRATAPGGLLVLCSCSAALGPSELVRSLALGARDVGLQPRVLERWFQGPDHPVAAAFPEGTYLSTVIATLNRIN